MLNASEFFENFTALFSDENRTSSGDGGVDLLSPWLTVGGFDATNISTSVNGSNSLHDSLFNATSTSLDTNDMWRSDPNASLFDTSSTDSTDDAVDWDGSMYPSRYSTLRIIFTAIFVTSLMIVIVVGNMLVIIAIVTEKPLKTIQNWFIASLAVSDFLLGLIVMPFSLANELMGYWIFGTWWCEIHQAVDVLLCTASILNICMISLDRYWSITKAVEYLKQRTPLRAAIMIFLVWIVSFVISVPPLLGWKKPDQPKDFPVCQVNDNMSYVIYSALGSFYIPSVIMVFVYIRIYIAARSRARRVMKRKNVMEAAKDKSTTTTSFSNASPPDRNKNSSSNKTTTTLSVGESLAVPATTPTSTPSPERRQESPTSPTFPAESKTEVKRCGNGTAKSTTGKSSSTMAVPRTPPATVTTPPPLGTASVPSVEQEDCVSEMEHSSDSDQYREVKAVGENNGESRVPLRRLRRLCRPPSKKKTSAPKERREEIDLGRLAPKIRDPEREKRRIARKRERRATLILGLIMASFILCWLPFFMIYLLSGMCKACKISDLAFAFAFWLGYVNSALNPIIYTIFNKDFRRAFRKILFK